MINIPVEVFLELEKQPNITRYQGRSGRHRLNIVLGHNYHSKFKNLSQVNESIIRYWYHNWTKIQFLRRNYLLLETAWAMIFLCLNISYEINIYLTWRLSTKCVVFLVQSINLFIVYIYYIIILFALNHMYHIRIRE